MILSDRDIRKALQAGRIRIDPMPDLESALGSVSIDFRLGTTFMVFEHSRHSFIDPRQPRSIGEAMRTIECAPDEPFIMQPGDFALASTVESLELADDLTLVAIHLEHAIQLRRPVVNEIMNDPRG